MKRSRLRGNPYSRRFASEFVRIVSLVPSITLALHQLGVGDRLVGRTDYCIHPEKQVGSIEAVGGTKDPDLQRIRALRPGLVVANSDEQREATLKELEDGPWDLLVTHTDSLEDVARTWEVLGEATGQMEEGSRRGQELQAAIAKARAAASRREPLEVLVPVWKNPFMAAGGGTYLGDLLAACGIRNVLAEEQEKWVLFASTLDEEKAELERPTKGPFKGRRFVVLPGAPQAVLLPTEPYAFQDAHRDLFASLGVPRERVEVVDGELLTWWLSHTTQALKVFGELAVELLARMPAKAR